MSSVKVYNDYHEDHVEKLDGSTIKIPSGGFIEMPRARAIRLVSQFAPVYKQGESNHETKPKRLRVVEEIKDTEKRLKVSLLKNTCMQCNQSFNTERELEVHVEMNHEDDLIDDEEVKSVKKAGRPRRYPEK